MAAPPLCSPEPFQHCFVFGSHGGNLPRLFITTSVHAIHQQCSLDSPPLCSPAPLKYRFVFRGHGGIFQDCSSLHHYMRFTNSFHWILHYCVHLHLFHELHFFITTSQCSLHSPPPCSPAPLWRTTSLHHNITVFTAFSLPLGSPSLQEATSGDHNMGESLCSGFSPLLWSSTSLYQTSRFITA